ncbi:hypothetical protein CYMTET_34532 [Cymbomonas tetramitiformis]|uniref:F-box domain-containing protein n=1 Tax=Cymbomonas tetramitiformis TaxID=36881 RepID=A0AAE0FBH5_9CHLO|nr:hypothetical protein CYMTET_34532 [Cymbomonas tetramitiformis]
MPNHLLVEIFLQLFPPETFHNLTQTCRKFRSVVDDDRLWCLHYQNRWGASDQRYALGSPRISVTSADGTCYDWHLTAFPFLSDTATWRERYMQRWRRIASTTRDVCTTFARGTLTAATWGTMPSLDFMDFWLPALRSLQHCQLSLGDLWEFLLIKEADVLVNLAGLQLFKMLPSQTEEEAKDYVAELFKVGIAERTVSIRWWMLGRLTVGHGWRGQDELKMVTGPLCELAASPEVWKVLQKGVMNEVRRICIVVEEPAIGFPFISA